MRPKKRPQKRPLCLEIVGLKRPHRRRSREKAVSGRRRRRGTMKDDLTFDARSDDVQQGRMDGDGIHDRFVPFGSNQRQRCETFPD